MSRNTETEPNFYTPLTQFQDEIFRKPSKTANQRCGASRHLLSSELPRLIVFVL